MIVATLPEPTVRPPSRALRNEIGMFFVDFTAYFYLYSPIFLFIFMVMKNFRAKIEPLQKYRFSP